jgi:hypothetical protein
MVIGVNEEYTLLLFIVKVTTVHCNPTGAYKYGKLNDP